MWTQNRLKQRPNDTLSYLERTRVRLVEPSAKPQYRPEVDPPFVGPHQHLTFVEADPPRNSWFAVWDPDDLGGLLQSEVGAASGTSPESGVELPTTPVDLVIPGMRSTSIATVSAGRLDLAHAIELLTLVRHNAEVTDSVKAWAAVVRAALGFIADGRVLPWVSPAGYDAWRVDPLSPSQLRLVDDLVKSMPAHAHCTPVAQGATSGRRQRLISDPTYAVRSACDAIADRFLRTPAAHRVGSLTLFANNDPTRVPHLRPWVQDLASAHCAACRLVLQVHPPGGTSLPLGAPDPDHAAPQPGDSATPPPWKVRFQLQSTSDPTLVIDAASYWNAPSEVIARMGNEIEVTLLAGLRTLGRLVPPLDSALDDLFPAQMTLADEHLDLLLDALDDLNQHRIDVRWPAELVAPRIERRLVASASTPNAPVETNPTVLDLKSLLSVDWEFLLDGVELTADELEVLGQAKRAVVPLRGRWVRLSQADRDRLKARTPEVTVGEVIAAGLSNNPTLSVTLKPDPDSKITEPGGGDFDPCEPGEVPIRLDGALADLVAQLTQLTRQRRQSEPTELNAQLRPYQQRGLAWMADLGALGVGGCLADDMGLGKTIQVLALHAHRQQVDHSPTLVVCPTSLVTNWQREAARFLPDTKVRVHHGPSRTLEGVKPGELVITTYGVVRGDTEELAAVDWGLMVADEAQQAKNPRSATARALRQIPARSRMALTGTPIENRLSEMWSIFDWAVPGLLGSLPEFRRTTAIPIERDGDQKATRKLNDLLAPFLLRRRKSDPGIAPELPPKIERDVAVTLSAEQATLYRAAVDQTLADIANAEGIQRRGLVLALITKLKQITNHPAQFMGDQARDCYQAASSKSSAPPRSATGGPDPDSRWLAGRSGKLDALDSILSLANESSESTLIFSQYVQMGRLLVDHLGSSGFDAKLLHGGLSGTARQRLVDDFQNGKLPVLVLSLKAAGTGLNLTRATNVVHFDRWWNPAVEDQATDRAYRIGQDKTVMVHRLITQGTVEDRVADILADKRRLADRVVGAAALGSGGGEAWIAEMSDAELAKLVVLDEIKEVATSG